MKQFVMMLILLCALPVLAKDKKDDAPTITDVQRLTLENLQLRAAPLQKELQELQKQYNKIITQIEEEHPGYMFNEQTGTLVKKTEAKEPAKK